MMPGRLSPWRFCPEGGRERKKETVSDSRGEGPARHVRPESEGLNNFKLL